MTEDIRRQSPFKELWDRLDSLPRQQRRIAEAVLQSPEIVVFGTIRDVSARLNTNSATIVRFAQAMGFAGYAEFQGVVRVAYLQRVADSQITATARPALRTPLEGVAFTRSQQVANLERTHLNFEAIDLESISAKLEMAKRIIIFAEAAADVPGTLLLRLMRHVKLSATLVSNEVDAMIAIHDVTAQDVVVVISLSVTFRAAVNVAAFARERAATIVAIVGNDMSPLARYAQHAIVAPTKSSTMWYSTVGCVAAVELVMSHVASRRRETVLREERELYDVYLDQSLVAPLEKPDDGGGRTTPEKD